MKNIPKNLFIYSLDQESCLKIIQSGKFIKSTTTGKPVIIVDFIDHRYSGRKRYKNKLRYYQNIKLKRSIPEIMYGYVEDEEYKKSLLDSFVGFYLPNSGFKLKINTSSIFTKYYGTCVLLELINERFDDLLYQPAIYLDTDKFIKLLNMCNGCLENGVIPGSYRIEINSLNQYSDYNLISEIDPNIEDKISMLVGELISNRKTRKLIPGHFYCFDNRSTFLCLGKINDVNGHSRKYYKNDPVRILSDCILPSIHGSYVDHIETGYLVVPLDYLDPSILTQIVGLSNKKVDIYSLVNYILEICISNWGIFRFEKMLSVVSEDVLAVDLGISVIDPKYHYCSVDLKDLLKESILELINNIDEFMNHNKDKIAKSFIPLYLFVSDDVVNDANLRKRFLDSIIDSLGDELIRSIKALDKNFLIDLISNYDDSKDTYRNVSLSYKDKFFARLFSLLISGLPEHKSVKITKEELNYIIDRIYAS